LRFSIVTLILVIYENYFVFRIINNAARLPARKGSVAHYLHSKNG
jgi:hypothetical protein